MFCVQPDDLGPDDNVDGGVGEQEPIDILEGDEAVDALQRQQPRERITTRYLTKYERARVLGTRALQIRYVLHSDCAALALITCSFHWGSWHAAVMPYPPFHS